jgi:ion channel POLLUX/CASTOR
MRMTNFSWRERLRYAFDNTLARGTVALVGWLAVVSVVAIALAGAVIAVFGVKPEGGEELGFGEAMWASLMRTLDAGTMGGDEGWAFRVVMFIVTLVGIFILSTLIGVLSSGLEGRIEQLRKGRSRVVEMDHTVILGWSEQVFALVVELVEANRSKPRATIAIMADRDKVEMEDELRARIDDFGTTHVVCRSGDPAEPTDLRIASLDTAQSIIVLAGARGEDDNDNEADVSVVKTIMAIVNAPERKRGAYNIVAELREPRHAEIAKLVGKDEVEVVLVGDLIARIIAQTCRHSGLSAVYNDLLDFDGEEIYTKPAGSLAGKTVREALLAFENATLIGIQPATGDAILNPPPNMIIAPDAQIMCVATDDDGWQAGSAANVNPAHCTAQATAPSARVPERILVLGWNWRGAELVRQLDQYVAQGTIIELYAGSTTSVASDVGGELKHTSLRLQDADITEKGVLVAALNKSPHHIIVLAESDEHDARHADNRTLMTLLQLRALMPEGARANVVTEMLDVKNRRLAESARVDDFIVSDRLVSLVLAQVSQNKQLNQVFAQLFDADGSEVYLKPASRYVALGVPVNMATVVAAVSAHGETAFGVRIVRDSASAQKNFGVKLNPPKSAQFTFEAGDQVVVLAVDET